MARRLWAAGRGEGDSHGGGCGARVRARRCRRRGLEPRRRQLDGVPAALDALEEVADAVAGRAEVLLDGGVRRGTDVLKALALGARAVLIGRAMLWGLAVAGEEGVADVLRMFRKEVELGLALLGCASPADVTRAHVT